MAQPGSALAWGARGRRFESFHTDQLKKQSLQTEMFEGFVFGWLRTVYRMVHHPIDVGLLDVVCQYFHNALCGSRGIDGAICVEYLHIGCIARATYFDAVLGNLSRFLGVAK